MDPIEVGDGVRVPGSALSFRAVRASGPGGQNVNKVASKVALRVDLALVEGLVTGLRADGWHPVLDPQPGHCCVVIGGDQL